MIADVQQKHEDLVTLCRKYRVRRLDLFGSAATEEDFDPARSDLDFLVDFESQDERGLSNRYFGLWDELKTLFGRDVHLVTSRSLRNPYFIASVEATRQEVYGS